MPSLIARPVKWPAISPRPPQRSRRGRGAFLIALNFSKIKFRNAADCSAGAAALRKKNASEFFRSARDRFKRLALLYAFSTSPALIALAETHTRLTAPLSVRTRTRCTLGLNVRLTCLTNCKPIPPLFLLCPLWIILRPLTGRLPVIEHILAMAVLSVLSIKCMLCLNCNFFKRRMKNAFTLKGNKNFLFGAKIVFCNF